LLTATFKDLHIENSKITKGKIAKSAVKSMLHRISIKTVKNVFVTPSSNFYQH